MRLPSVITDTIAAAIAAELRRQHADIVAERDAAAARAAAAEAAASAARAAVLDLEAAIAGMSRGMAERDAEVAKLRREIEDQARQHAAKIRGLIDSYGGRRPPHASPPTPPAVDEAEDAREAADAIRAAVIEHGRPVEGDSYVDTIRRMAAERDAAIAARDEAVAKLHGMTSWAGEVERAMIAAERARDDAPAGQGKTKRNPDRNADRGRVLREALRGSCPTCEAPAGKPCYDDDDGGREVSPHPDRIGAARKRLATVTARLSVRCPTCDAPEGVPCVVDGRKGLHIDRQVKP